MATLNNTTWQGYLGLTQTKKGEWKANAQEVICALEYEGPYQVALNQAPLIGDTIGGYTAYDVKVFSWQIVHLPGGIGRLMVLLRNPFTLEIIRNPDFLQVGDPEPHLLWQPFKKRVEDHPKCGTWKPDPSVAGQDVSSRTPGSHLAAVNYNQVTGGWTYDQYQSIIQAGIDDYDDKQPLLTLVTHSYGRPQNLGLNNFTLDVPDATVLPVPPGDWLWLRGGDDLSRQDKLWKLTQTWTGFAPGVGQETPFQLLYDVAIG